jgi:exodeoxyribonuclease (lambda-induced)
MSAVLIEQGSKEWLEARCGSLTASRFAEAVARLKGGDYAKSRHDLMIELLSERLTGLTSPHYISREMLEGIEWQPAAAAAYEFEHDVECAEVGYCEHPTIPWAGASPDYTVGADGLLEVKAPKSATFTEVRLAKEFGYVYPKARESSDDGYLVQCQWQLACCPTRKWCDLAYYDARMPIGKQLFVRRLNRDDAIIAAMEDEARKFLDELQKLQDKFMGIAGAQA